MWQRHLLNKGSRVCVNLFEFTRCNNTLRYKTSDACENDDAVNALEKSSEEHVKKLLNDAANFNEVTDTSWASNPYPEGAVTPSDEQKRPVQDPTTATILQFPGQGTVKVGQVKQYLQIPRAKQIFDIANEFLNMDLLKLCLKGPQEKLNRTEFNQIATVVTSLAALEKMWEERPLSIEQCKAVAGYSVGELTALIFSGAITLEDGIRLAAVRGAAMQHASNLTPQGMLLIHTLPQTKIGLICEEAQKWATNMGVENPLCKIAIYIYSEAKILAGDDVSLKYIESNYTKLAIHKPIRLPVSGAFHTELMQPAIKSFKKALEKVDIMKPRINTYSNVTGKRYHSDLEVRKLLIKQLIAPVKWQQIIHTIYGRSNDMNFPRTFELGSGGSLTYIFKRINSKAARSCVSI